MCLLQPKPMTSIHFLLIYALHNSQSTHGSQLYVSNHWHCTNATQQVQCWAGGRLACSYCPPPRRSGHSADHHTASSPTLPKTLSQHRHHRPSQNVFSPCVASWHKAVETGCANSLRCVHVWNWTGKFWQTSDCWNCRINDVAMSGFICTWR